MLDVLDKKITNTRIPPQQPNNPQDFVEIFLSCVPISTKGFGGGGSLLNLTAQKEKD